MLTIRLTARGGFRHVQHVRPNRGTHKKGAPTGQRLSDASFRMQKAVFPISIQITAAILRTVHMYLPNVLYINVRKFMRGRGPHIFTEQGPIGFKSGPVHSFILSSFNSDNLNTQTHRRTNYTITDRAQNTYVYTTNKNKLIDLRKSTKNL